MNLLAHLALVLLLEVVLVVVKVRALAVTPEIASSVVRVGTGLMSVQMLLARKAEAGRGPRALVHLTITVLRAEHVTNVARRVILVTRVQTERPRNHEVWPLLLAAHVTSVDRKGTSATLVPVLEEEGRKAALRQPAHALNAERKGTIAMLAPAEALVLLVTGVEEQLQNDREGVAAVQAELRALEEAASAERRSLDSLQLMVFDRSVVYGLLSICCFSYVIRYAD